MDSLEPSTKQTTLNKTSAKFKMFSISTAQRRSASAVSLSVARPQAVRTTTKKLSQSVYMHTKNRQFQCSTSMSVLAKLRELIQVSMNLLPINQLEKQCFHRSHASLAQRLLVKPLLVTLSVRGPTWNWSTSMTSLVITSLMEKMTKRSLWLS